MADIIEGRWNKKNKVYLFKSDEGKILIEEGDTVLTISMALCLLDRAAICLKKEAGWIS